MIFQNTGYIPHMSIDFFFFLTSNTKDQQSDEIRMALDLTAAALEAPRQLSKIPRENHFQPRHVQQAKLNIE